MATQELLIPDVFPDRDPELEDLVQKYNRAKSAAKKAETAVTARYDAILAAMEQKELDIYFCYDARFYVDHRPQEAPVKVKPVSESMPSPFRPQTSSEQGDSADSDSAA